MVWRDIKPGGICRDRGPASRRLYGRAGRWAFSFEGGSRAAGVAARLRAVGFERVLSFLEDPLLRLATEEPGDRRRPFDAFQSLLGDRAGIVDLR